MWIALFSQSGTEIAEVSKQLGRWPDFIFTNNKDKKTWHTDLKHRSTVFRLPHNGIVEEIKSIDSLMSADRGKPLITLHGYLRIMPDLPYEMYNGHPGDIVTYPELKGKDPQVKALKLNLPSTGCVIHEVTSEVDGGKIVAYKQYTIEESLEELTLINNLRILSIGMWVEFLKEKFDER